MIVLDLKLRDDKSYNKSYQGIYMCVQSSASWLRLGKSQQSSCSGDRECLCKTSWPSSSCWDISVWTKAVDWQTHIATLHTATTSKNPSEPVKSCARYLSSILDRRRLNNMNDGAASADPRDSGSERRISSTFSLLSAGPSLQTLFWLDVKIDLLRLPPQHQHGTRHEWFFIGLICKTALWSAGMDPVTSKCSPWESKDWKVQCFLRHVPSYLV